MADCRKGGETPPNMNFPPFPWSQFPPPPRQCTSRAYNGCAAPQGAHSLPLPRSARPAAPPSPLSPRPASLPKLLPAVTHLALPPLSLAQQDPSPSFVAFSLQGEDVILGSISLFKHLHSSSCFAALLKIPTGRTHLFVWRCYFSQGVRGVEFWA